MNIAVIGAGPIAEHHLAALAAVDGASVRVVCSRRPERRASLAATFAIPEQADSYAALVGRRDIDAVLVLVAPDAMQEVGSSFLEWGIPTFLEKPPALSAEGTRAMAAIARRTRAPHMVGLNRRFYSTVECARTAVRQSGGLLGVQIEAPEDLARAAAAGRDPGLLSRWIVANGIHGVDLLRYLGGGISEKWGARQGAPGRADFGVVASFAFESGALGQYSAHWGSAGRWSLKLFGRDLVVQLSPLESGVLLDRARHETPVTPDEIDRRFKPGFLRQLEAFRDLAANGAVHPAIATLEDSAASMELAEWLGGLAA